MVSLFKGRVRRRREVTRKRGAPAPAVVVFARAPAPGKVKTRLIPSLGAEGAAALHAALLQDTLRKVNAFPALFARYLYLQGRASIQAPPSYTRVRQRGRGLGERLSDAFARLIPKHSRVVIVGTDSPLLPARALRAALGELRVCDAVLGPCPDGGYYLLGLRRFERGLLRGIRWGTRFAFRDTLGNLLRHSYSCSILESCPDVDRPEDVRRLIQRLAHDPAARRLAPATWRCHCATKL